MTGKKYKLTADEIQPLIPNLGACMASDRILVDGAAVGVMYRDPPQEDGDSGWVFMAGDESQAYLDNPDNVGVYAVNTVANYARDAVGFLTYPTGTRVERRDGVLTVVEGPGEPPSMRLLPAVEEGPVRLTKTWNARVSQRMMRRIDDGALVLWKPGLTVYLTAYGVEQGESPEQRMAAYLERASQRRTRETQRASGGVHSVRYHLEEGSGDSRQASINGICLSGRDELLVAAYFDRLTDEAGAIALFDSIESNGG